MKFYFLIIILCSFLLIVNCESEGESASNHKDSLNIETSEKDVPGNNENNSIEKSGIPVEVTSIIRGEIAKYLLYNSTLETEQMADVYSRISGLVEELYVEEGDRVNKDQALLQIEQDEYILEEEKARLQYDTQVSEFRRFEALKTKNLISEEEFETARLTVRQAELQWKQAKLNLDYTIVRAPINGIVGERQVRLGDRIQTTTRLMMVSNPLEKVVKLYIPQDEIPNCYVNQLATITTDVFPDKEFAGWVKRISPIIDPTSGTFKVTAGVKDPKNELRPGMFVSVSLVIDIRNDTKLIPKTALYYENERTYFFIVESDTVKRLELKKGFEDAEKVEILNPVSDSLKVVIVGQSGLKTGNKVNVVSEKKYDWQKEKGITINDIRPQHKSIGV